MKTSFMRSRWAAIGAVVSITLGAGGLHFAGAILPYQGPNPVTTLITPCRLMDTRSPGGVGSRTTPIASGETYEVHASSGNCTIPAAATGIVTNVTIANPGSSGFLTVFPADVAKPLASNLNWVAGQSPTPNAVTTGLSTTGTIGNIKIFNGGGTGSVNVIVDIVGYISPADLLTTNSCKEFPHEEVVWDGCNFKGAYLVNANIAGGTVLGTDFTRVFFNNGYAVNTSFFGSNLTDSDFGGADLRNANFAAADLTNVDFTGANLSFANFQPSTTITGIDWTNAACPDLTNASSHGQTCIGHL
ncbi:MAG: pentapeptide repeat-containing protein [Actinomycetes bacterium]